MAPQDVKKGAHSKKMRFTANLDADEDIWNNAIDPSNYVLVNPGTQLVCESCFSKVEDIAQHSSKRSACSLHMANRHLTFCYEENTITSFRPKTAIVSAMVLDKDCPLTARDIVAQPSNWNPTTNFKNVNHLGHTVTEALTTTSFQALYDGYLADNPTMNDAHNTVMDLTTVPFIGATGVHNLTGHMIKVFEDYYQRRVDQDVKAGRLTKND